MSALRAAIVATGLALASAGRAAAACDDGARAALALAAAAVAQDDLAGAVARLAPATGDCAERVAALAGLHGWMAARAASDAGGAPAALGAAQRALDTLATSGPAASDAAYAHALVKAAVAAAQDERDDLQVWLEHAHDLSRRLGVGRAAPRWPLPIDAAEGELWFAVDDFELSEAAFTRALAAPAPPAMAWRGLARARDRRGDRVGACAAYRRTLDVMAPDSPSAAEARAYVLLCGP